MDEKKAFHDLERIFTRAVDSVNPENLIRDRLNIKGDRLTITSEDGNLDIDIRGYTRIVVIGAGKATARMAKAVEAICGDRITEGLISVKYGHTEPLSIIETIEAGHPVPDFNSLDAAARILEMADRADEQTLILNLISGGGSALLAAPLHSIIEGVEVAPKGTSPEGLRSVAPKGTSSEGLPSVAPKGTSSLRSIALTLEELQETTRVLLGSGATIEEVNCIRKHLSAIKGGRLAEHAYPALQINLLLSDVIGDRLDTIASGLSTHDNTTYNQALAILEKYGIQGAVPARVTRTLEAGGQGLIPETPKRGAALFERVNNLIIGNNLVAVRAAVGEAKHLGYDSIALSSRIIGEAREAAKVFAGIVKDVQRHGILAGKPSCIVWGGETTVTLQGSGKGGRNQEFALSFLLELQEYAAGYEQGIALLAASTDGNDGPTDAAGAYASTGVLVKSAELSLDPLDYLKNNDSYTFFDKTGFLLRTGPTNTNVCDLQIALVA
jgi:glycerate 2-kinase